MRAKTTGRLVGLTWLAVAFVFANSTGPLAVTPAGASDTLKTKADIASGTAQYQAQAYLARFYTFSMSSVGKSARPRVQISLDGTTVWAKPLATTEQGYSATLLEDSRAGQDGDVVEFKLEDVRDWRFLGRNRIFYGEFHQRAKLAEMSREDAARLGGTLTTSPVPPGW